MRPRVLVAGTDEPVFLRIAAALQCDGSTVEHVATARDALYRVTGGDHALVIVAHDVAGIDGPALVAAMRGAGVNAPILALDAQAGSERCVRMLKAGADDYQPAPFDIDEMRARVAAHLRRRSRAWSEALASPGTLIHAGGAALDRIHRTVSVDAICVALRPTEFRLLEFLMMNPDRVLTRRMILEAVWQHHFDPGTNLVEVHVKQLRAKLDDRAGTRFIRTVRGAGYFFCGDATLADARAARGTARDAASSARTLPRPLAAGLLA